VVKPKSGGDIPKVRAPDSATRLSLYALTLGLYCSLITLEGNSLIYELMPSREGGLVREPSRLYGPFAIYYKG
jgi:hypothetical protein